MRDNDIKIGDLVCFDGDESQNIFGIGLVADIKGDEKDFEEFNRVIEKIENSPEDLWKLTDLPVTKPMILVFWASNNPIGEKKENSEITSMWVFPTEIRKLN